MIDFITGSIAPYAIALLSIAAAYFGFRSKSQENTIKKQKDEIIKKESEAIILIDAIDRQKAEIRKANAASRILSSNDSRGVVVDRMRERANKDGNSN